MFLCYLHFACNILKQPMNQQYNRTSRVSGPCLNSYSLTFQFVIPSHPSVNTTGMLTWHALWLVSKQDCDATCLLISWLVSADVSTFQQTFLQQWRHFLWGGPVWPVDDTTTLLSNIRIAEVTLCYLYTPLTEHPSTTAQPRTGAPHKISSLTRHMLAGWTLLGTVWSGQRG